MRYSFVLCLVLVCLFVQSAFAHDDECFCISSNAVRKYSDKEFLNLVKNEIKLNQEKIAARDIQRLINQGLEADEAKDIAASNHNQKILQSRI